MIDSAPPFLQQKPNIDKIATAIITYIQPTEELLHTVYSDILRNVDQRKAFALFVYIQTQIIQKDKLSIISNWDVALRQWLIDMWISSRTTKLLLSKLEKHNIYNSKSGWLHINNEWWDTIPTEYLHALEDLISTNNQRQDIVNNLVPRIGETLASVNQ